MSYLERAFQLAADRPAALSSLTRGGFDTQYAQTSVWHRGSRAAEQSGCQVQQSITVHPLFHRLVLLPDRKS